MGAYGCKGLRNDPSNVYKDSGWDGRKDRSARKNVSMLPSSWYRVEDTKLETPMKQSSLSQTTNIYNQHFLAQLSHEPNKTKASSSPTASLQTTEIDKQYFSTNVRFLLFGLENQMNRTSEAMLRILKPIMASHLMMVKDLKQFKRIQSTEKLRLFLFTSAEYADWIGKTLSNGEKIFVLGASTNPSYKIFESIQDLIFQIAEEFAQWYSDEAHQYEKLGASALAECKHKTISEMYRQLMNVSTEEITINPSICTDTSVIWLTRNRNTTDEEKLTQITPSLVVFDNEQTCWNHVIQYDNETAIFLLVDSNCEPSMIKRLEGLAQVKHLYRTESFVDIDKLCFRLTHDLIKHYGELGDQLTAARRDQEARQMFLRAQQLCKILF